METLASNLHMRHFSSKSIAMWKWKDLRRMQVHLWKVVHDKLPTNLSRSKLSSSSPDCLICSRNVETMLHVVRDFPMATRMWLGLVKFEKQTFFSEFDGVVGC